MGKAESLSEQKYGLQFLVKSLHGRVEISLFS